MRSILKCQPDTAEVLVAFEDFANGHSTVLINSRPILTLEASHGPTARCMVVAPLAVSLRRSHLLHRCYPLRGRGPQLVGTNRGDLSGHCVFGGHPQSPPVG